MLPILTQHFSVVHLILRTFIKIYKFTCCKNNTEHNLIMTNRFTNNVEMKLFPPLVATVSILQDSIEVSESGGHAIITVQRLGLSQIDMPLVVSVEEQSALGIYIILQSPYLYWVYFTCF